LGVVSMKQLLEAGVHFGHRTMRWNPKMKEYIYTDRKGVHIMDLQKTLRLLEEAYYFVRNQAAEGATILFVGTKRQAQQSVEEEAKRCGGLFITNRWLGGLLTNFPTIKARIAYMKELEAQEEDGSLNALPKQEQAVIRHELSKLQKNLGGVRDMKDLPDILFIVDPKKERNAVLEGNLLKIPIVATLDTNCDPDEIDYIIPGNDDAIRAIRLITSKIADAFLEGREGYNQQEQAEAAESDQPEAKDEDSEKQDDTVIENDKSEDADSVKKEEVVSD